MLKKWTPPSRSNLTREIRAHDRLSLQSRAERLKFVYEILGPDQEMLLVGGINSMLALHEIKSSFIEGNFLATILCCQIFIESSLGGSYIISGEDSIAEGGMKKLIDNALSDGVISNELHKKLDELRKMRIAYGHMHGGLKDRSLMKRILDRQSDPVILVENDARDAVEITAAFFAETCNGWEPI